MPKVTLLGKPTRTLNLFFGKKEFKFSSGVPQDVPVAVALALGRRIGRKGKPLFKVEELPSIVSKAEPTVMLGVAAMEQNVFTGPRQMRLGTWL